MVSFSLRNRNWSWSTVRPNKFLGFMQLRLGVFMLSGMLFLFGGIVSAFAYMQLVSLPKHPLKLLDNISLTLHAILWTLISLVSSFGIYATFRISTRLLTIYWILLANLLLASLVQGAFVFYVIFSPNTRAVVNKCLGGLKDDFTLAGCRNGLAMYAGVAVAIYVVVWGLLTYSALITWAYTYQVKKGLDYDENAPVKPESISHPAPLTMYNSFGAPGHNNGYAFSSVDNSFGKPAGSTGSLNSTILGGGVGAGGHSRNFSGSRLNV